MSCTHNFAPKLCFSGWCGGNVEDGSSLDPPGWVGGINHLISRESTMDIGVMGDRDPNSGQEESLKQKCKKIIAKVEKNFAAPLKIKSSPKFSTKGKVNLIIKHCKLYKRKKNGFVWNFGPLNLQSLWKRFTQNFKKIFTKQMSSDVERENSEIQKLNLFGLIKAACIFCHDGRIRKAIVLVSILFENLLKGY